MWFRNDARRTNVLGPDGVRRASDHESRALLGTRQRATSPPAGANHARKPGLGLDGRLASSPAQRGAPLRLQWLRSRGKRSLWTRYPTRARQMFDAMAWANAALWDGNPLARTLRALQGLRAPGLPGSSRDEVAAALHPIGRPPQPLLSQQRSRDSSRTTPKERQSGR